MRRALEPAQPLEAGAGAGGAREGSKKSARQIISEIEQISRDPLARHKQHDAAAVGEVEVVGARAVESSRPPISKSMTHEESTSNSMNKCHRAPSTSVPVSSSSFEIFSDVPQVAKTAIADAAPARPSHAVGGGAISTSRQAPPRAKETNSVPFAIFSDADAHEVQQPSTAVPTRDATSKASSSSQSVARAPKASGVPMSASFSIFSDAPQAESLSTVASKSRDSKSTKDAKKHQIAVSSQPPSSGGFSIFCDGDTQSQSSSMKPQDKAKTKEAKVGLEQRMPSSSTSSSTSFTVFSDDADQSAATGQTKSKAKVKSTGACLCPWVF